MAYVPVPKDLNAVKTKVLFNLTKRQLVCFGSGAAVAVPLFFLCKSAMSTSVASIIMIIPGSPQIYRAKSGAARRDQTAQHRFQGKCRYGSCVRYSVSAETRSSY